MPGFAGEAASVSGYMSRMGLQVGVVCLTPVPRNYKRVESEEIGEQGFAKDL